MHFSKFKSNSFQHYVLPAYLVSLRNMSAVQKLDTLIMSSHLDFKTYVINCIEGVGQFTNTTQKHDRDHSDNNLDTCKRPGNVDFTSILNLLKIKYQSHRGRHIFLKVTLRQIAQNL